MESLLRSGALVLLLAGGCRGAEGPHVDPSRPMTSGPECTGLRDEWRDCVHATRDEDADELLDEAGNAWPWCQRHVIDGSSWLVRTELDCNCDGDLDVRTIYLRDPAGRLLRAESEDLVGIEYDSSTTYVRDAQGRVVREESTRYGGDQPVEMRTWQYDSTGRVQRSVVTRPGPPVEVFEVCLSGREVRPAWDGCRPRKVEPDLRTM